MITRQGRLGGIVRGRARVFTAVATTVVAVVGLAPSVSAAPVRDDSRTERVYLVHGIRLFGDADCASVWADTRWSLRRDGWLGPIDTVAFYRGDRNCTAEVPGRSVYTPDTSIRELGRAFAWLVYERDTRYGRSVDVVGHSMGGLVVRAALTGVHNHERGFPARLYIEDVVTLSTPHAGLPNRSCIRFECGQMRGQDGRRLLGWLRQNPQSAQGTDWTLIGSNADALVPAASVDGMRAGHKILYSVDGKLGHNTIALRPDPAYPARRGYHLSYWNASRPGVHETANGWAPLHLVERALYYWKKW